MAHYTTEVRTICEALTSNVRSGASKIDDIVNEAIPKIFTDNWETYNPEHKTELCDKILKHYYFREIGVETVPLWIFMLNRKLTEIMPKYNKMYEVVEKAYINPLNMYDMTETENITGDETTTLNGSTQSTSSGEMSGTNTGSGTSESTSTSDSNAVSEAWQKYNDTPQGGITGLDQDMYLTNATKNTSTSDSDTTSDSKSTSTSNATSESTSSSTSQSSNDSTGVVKSLEERIRNTKGINGQKSYFELARQALDMYVNVDMQVIKELETLFMQLW